MAPAGDVKLTSPATASEADARNAGTLKRHLMLTPSSLAISHFMDFLSPELLTAAAAPLYGRTGETAPDSRVRDGSTWTL
jgi:hypothetical protein